MTKPHICCVESWRAIHMLELLQTTHQLRRGAMSVPPATDQFRYGTNPIIQPWLSAFLTWPRTNHDDPAFAMAADELSFYDTTKAHDHEDHLAIDMVEAFVRSQWATMVTHPDTWNDVQALSVRTQLKNLADLVPAIINKDVPVQRRKQTFVSLVSGYGLSDPNSLWASLLVLDVASIHRGGATELLTVANNAALDPLALVLLHHNSDAHHTMSRLHPGLLLPVMMLTADASFAAARHSPDHDCLKG